MKPNKATNNSNTNTLAEVSVLGLRKLAELAGVEVESQEMMSGETVLIVLRENGDGLEVWNPRQNAGQLMECVEAVRAANKYHFMIYTMNNGKYGCGFWSKETGNPTDKSKGETLHEAIYAALTELVKGEG